MTMELSVEAYTAWQDEAQRERLLMDQLPQVRYIARRIHEHPAAARPIRRPGARRGGGLNRRLA